MEGSVENYFLMVSDPVILYYLCYVIKFDLPDRAFYESKRKNDLPFIEKRGK